MQFDCYCTAKRIGGLTVSGSVLFSMLFRAARNLVGHEETYTPRWVVRCDNV